MAKTRSEIVNAYAKKAYDDIRLQVPKGQKAIIKAHADSRNETLGGFIKRAIAETMARDAGRELPEMQKKAKKTDSETEKLRSELLKKLNDL